MSTTLCSIMHRPQARYEHTCICVHVCLLLFIKRRETDPQRHYHLSAKAYNSLNYLRNSRWAPREQRRIQLGNLKTRGQLRNQGGLSGEIKRHINRKEAYDLTHVHRSVQHVSNKHLLRYSAHTSTGRLKKKRTLISSLIHMPCKHTHLTRTDRSIVATSCTIKSPLSASVPEAHTTLFGHKTQSDICV